MTNDDSVESLIRNNCIILNDAELDTFGTSYIKRCDARIGQFSIRI